MSDAPTWPAPTARASAPGNARRARLVASLTEAPADDGEALRQLAGTVDVLEVRADLVGNLDPEWLRQRFDGDLLYTLRSKAEGGQGESRVQSRIKLLAEAAQTYDLVDLEAERDLRPELLVKVRQEQRLISWHGPATHLSDLKTRFFHLAGTEAHYYKLVPHAATSGDGVLPLALLHAVQRDDVIAFASGELATWTRLLAPRLGAPVVYGALAGQRPAAPGQLSVARLVQDYGLPALAPLQGLYGIVGDPVSHSRSPRLHNGAYRELGLPYLYLPFHVETFADFWIDVVEAGSLEVLGYPLRGLSVTSPYKEVALAVSGASSPRAQHINAANTLVKNGEVWEAETTDPEGVVLPLRRRGVQLKGARAAVVGCGGAGKAAAYGLQLEGALVTLVNRNEERGERAAVELALPFVPLSQLDTGSYDLVLNATSLGHKPQDPLPFDLGELQAHATVVDLVYDREVTPLVAQLRQQGAEVVEGLEVLLSQALEQFRLMTGQALSPELARRLLDLPPEQEAEAGEPSGGNAP